MTRQQSVRSSDATAPGAWNFLRLLVLAVLLACALLPVARAQDAQFKDEELDQMLAPIALYPDSLLSQILMASTYPADVAEAAAWSKAHPDKSGDAAVEMVADRPWEPAVQSLVAFPQVLAMMRDKPGDVQRLGDAFLADPGRVMDRVQFMRQKAQEAGNLKTTEQQNVTVQTEANKQVIVIEPAQPQTVYVPVYQPTVVYGTWWYPAYPPYYWPPPPYYYPGVHAGAFVAGVFWGAAIVGIHNSLWGGCNWGRRDVSINVNRYNNINVNRRITNNNNTFQHNANRRGDVPYRDAKSREQYGKKQLQGASDRQAYRGKDGRDAQRAQASETLKSRGADPVAGREKLQGADRDRAANAARQTDRSRPAPDGATDRRAPSGALSDVRDGSGSRVNADRGRTSRESMNQRAAAPSRAAAPQRQSPAARPSQAPRPSPAGRPAGRGGRGR
ncbi:MAG: DUF3300 domain-containing protein [Rubrivivax sp.]|nr:DUF3300 domain-containing protein [Rubrivivax sp.]